MIHWCCTNCHISFLHGKPPLSGLGHDIIGTSSSWLLLLYFQYKNSVFHYIKLHREVLGVFIHLLQLLNGAGWENRPGWHQWPCKTLSCCYIQCSSSVKSTGKGKEWGEGSRLRVEKIGRVIYNILVIFMMSLLGLKLPLKMLIMTFLDQGINLSK